jgi:hypothetical protein
VLAEFGYAPFAFRQFDFGVAGMDAKTLNARYLCHHNGDRYLRAAPDRRIVTTGFGMSGVPRWDRTLTRGLPAALEAMYLLSRYVEQADFDAAEEDNHDYYAMRGSHPRSTSAGAWAP